MAHLPIGPVRPGGTGPQTSARLLASVREAALAGKVPRTAPRAVIGESWRRALRLGVDPDNGTPNGVLSTDEIEHRRRSTPIAEILPGLRDGLVSVADAAWHIMVVTDAEGRVLWRDGSLAVRRSADRLGFAEGASWAEDTVGTNAIGTALITGTPLQVHSAEHFVRTHHGWTCAAAPLHDPRDGRLLGVVDVSGPVASVHPATLALVSAVARVAEGELRTRHWAAVERLRSVAAPLLARIAGQALVVDGNGWTAAVTGMAPPDRVPLPAQARAGQVWLPSLGLCELDPLPGGWLIRPGARERPPAGNRVVLDLSGAGDSTVTVHGPAGNWAQPLSPRHAELLFVLALHRGGRSAAQLAADLFGDPSRTVTVRAEMSRLRRTLGGVLAHRPYRFADGVEVELLRPLRGHELLPRSLAPAVLAERE
ncbi:GAF domain-containing protein [Actinacidiphila yanglinensis]|uniref:GAF domain-containing protein n=1 Tax=Actinacidiphila yanglinensis TaxID=310779 RepID=A0A1H5XES5_9ACTN|nr:helix-turn-helix domain-containing protein [Actinacidiphila yanglinensis]SEG09975.1 GAF domain-containing protein [Actinacidiphila yanglinensis]